MTDPHATARALLREPTLEECLAQLDGAAPWRAAVVRAAWSQLGVQECGGPNCGIPDERYMGGLQLDASGRRLGGPTMPWCAGFAAWCLTMGRPGWDGPHLTIDLAGRLRYSAQGWSRRAAGPKPGGGAHQGSLWESLDTDGAQVAAGPGAVAFYAERGKSDRGGAGAIHHAAIVVYVDEHAELWTIDGNWGDAVRLVGPGEHGLVVGYGWP